MVSAGGRVTVTHVSTGGPDDVLVGYTTNAGANKITVTGAGSQFSSSQSGLYIGFNSNGNELDVLNGGAVTTNLMRVGGGTGSVTPGSGNIVRIDGAGSTLSVNQTLRVGSGGSGNQLIVSNGGHVGVTGNLFDGFDVNSSNNQISVSGTNSQLTAGALLVGNGGGTNNSLLVGNGGVVTAGTLSLSSSSFYHVGIDAAKPSLVTVPALPRSMAPWRRCFPRALSLTGHMTSCTPVPAPARSRPWTCPTCRRASRPASPTRPPTSSSISPRDSDTGPGSTSTSRTSRPRSTISSTAAARCRRASSRCFGLTGGNLSAALLSKLSGETATGSQQTTFNAMNQFMGVLTDPFIDGRGDRRRGGAAASHSPKDDASAYAALRAAARARRLCDVHQGARAADPFEQRWSVWAAGFGGSQTTDGNAALGSNNTTSRIYGTAVGADYRFSPNTIAGFALAGGGTNFSVANGWLAAAPTCSRPAPSSATMSARPMSPARWPMAGRTSPPTAP